MIRQKDLVFLLASSTVVTFIWIGATLYQAAVTSKIQEPLTTLIRPISDHFDTDAVSHITARRETIPTYEATGSRLLTPSNIHASASGMLSVTESPSPTPNITPEEDTL